MFLDHLLRAAHLKNKDLKEIVLLLDNKNQMKKEILKKIITNLHLPLRHLKFTKT